MNQYSKKYDDKELSTLFKEVQAIRYGHAKPKEFKDPRENVKFNRIYVIDKKFNVFGAIIGILFVIMFFTLVHSNSIFATSEEEKIAIAQFEENQLPIEIMEIISNNISTSTTKEISTSEFQIPYETVYVDNSQLPLNEEVIIENGKVGYLDKTVIKTFENEELISENVISEITKTEPVTEVIERGTSEFLYNMQAHIGDILYTSDVATMYQKPNENEEEIVCMIYPYIDIKVMSVKDGWTYVSVDEKEGYVKNDIITSAAIYPEIIDLCRKQRILVGVNSAMALNKPSGLTKEDFIRVLSNHEEDRENVIQDCAEYFYEAEQNYNVNGLFLASIGIHESNWGTSNISKQKKNLFGYGSYDSSPFSSSFTFESYQYGIDLVAKVLAKYYLNEQGTPIYDNEVASGNYYNGPTVAGVNIRYASDTNWSNRVYTIMESLYKEL